MVHQDVCGAFGFGRGNGKHIRATAKAVREKEDVGISSSRYRQGPKIVNTDGNARAVGQGDGEDGAGGWGGRASELSGGRSYAPDEEAAHPLFRADFHADPPVKTFKHFEGVHSTEMT